MYSWGGVASMFSEKPGILTLLPGDFIIMGLLGLFGSNKLFWWAGVGPDFRIGISGYLEGIQ